MTRTALFLATLALVAVLLCGGTAQAAKGGNGGGKPGGGGGEEPAASPEIVYFVSKGDKVMVMDADGENATLVVRRVSGFTVQPSWSPDGNTLIFNATNDGTGVYAVAATGGSPTRLTATSSQYLNRPVWSPVPTADGSAKILFEDAAANGSRDLFLMNTDGTGRVNLTNTADVDEEHPTWSPDARQIAAVASFADGGVWGSEVRVYGLGPNGAGNALTLGTGTDLTVGTALGHGDLAFLDWNRTGDKLAVSCYDPVTADWDLWLLDAAGVDAPQNLTSTSTVSERQATWSPDDAEIAYWHDGGEGARGVYVMPAGGGTPTALASEGVAPEWKRP